MNALLTSSQLLDVELDLRTDPASQQLCELVAEVVADHCSSRKAFLNPHFAATVADQARRRGNPVYLYRCSFTGGARANAHWHIGPYPSVRDMQRLAKAIRARAQGIA